MTIGQRIKELRKGKGINGAQLARMIGTSKGYLWEIENGREKFSIQLLINISRALNVSTDFVLFGLQQPSPYSMP